MSDEPDEIPDWMKTQAGIEEQTEAMVRDLDQMSEEEFETRLEERGGELVEMYEAGTELGKEDMQEFFSGLLGYMQQRRELQAEMEDVSGFDYYAWEDGFAFLDEITGDDDVSPICLECHAGLHPEVDEIRVATGGSGTYTNCSKCGETTFKDNRASSNMIEDSLSDVPNQDEIESRMPTEVREELWNEI